RGANETSRGYRPVTVLSYALVYHGIGKAREQAARLAEDPKAAEVSAHPQHLLNVLIQVLNTWLLWLLLVRVAGGGWPALVGTLVFGVHAIHSGPVASIVGRGELLAFSFGAAAAVLYLDGVRSATPGTSWRAAGLLVGSAVLLWLAFCAKESALAWVFFLPCLRLAQHWGSARDQDTTHRLRRDLWLWPAVVVLPVVCFVWLYVRTVWHLDYLPSYLGNPLLHGPAAERFMTAPMLWGYGLYKVLLPFSLACDYSTATFELVRSPWDPRLLGALVVLVGILWAGLRCARRHPLVFLAMASFLGFSFIVSNVPFGLETGLGGACYLAGGVGMDDRLPDGGVAGQLLPVHPRCQGAAEVPEHVADRSRSVRHPRATEGIRGLHRPDPEDRAVVPVRAEGEGETAGRRRGPGRRPRVPEARLGLTAVDAGEQG
ncbi:MAG: protein O-mannosyl-transferase TMTC1-related protein, partial [Planctomycetota bacterium]